MKATELREMTDVELNKQLKDPIRIEAVKKDIARVMTVLAEKNAKNA